jgi:uncharacterized alpha-E superfamily protein
VRALASRATEAGGASGPALRALAHLLFWTGTVPPGTRRKDPRAVTLVALATTGAPSAIPLMAQAALTAASHLRDRFSPDAWRSLRRLCGLLSAPLEPSEPALSRRVEDALQLVAAFSGLAQENMSRMAGWRFLELGRRIERGIVTCTYVRFLSGAAVAPAGLDLLLELCDSVITYGLRYVMAASAPHVLDLVMLDAHNPRSVAFQVDQLVKHLDELPVEAAESRPAPFHATSARIALELRSTPPDALGAAFATGLTARLMQLSDEITAAYFAPRGLAASGWDGTA